MVSARPRDALAALFGAGVAGPELTPSYNLAPTAEVYAVANGAGNQRRLGSMRWGLVPSWATAATGGRQPINARAETLTERPIFADALARRRCLLPVDGFYEWRREPLGHRQPFYFSAGDGSPLALGGLWDRWTGPGGTSVVSCAVITTTANETVASVHGRMPVILDPSNWDAWLDRDFRDVTVVARLLRPAPAHVLARWPVSARVNNVANDGPGLLTPEESPRRQLFGSEPL